MQFRKFEAVDMREALAAVKLALGEEAVIVATRQLAPRGLFRKPRIEVTAALEETPKMVAPPVVSDTNIETKLDPLRRELRALRGALQAQDKDPGIKAELLELRQMLASLSTPAAAATHDNAKDLFVDILAAADVEPALVTQLGTLAHKRLLKYSKTDHAPTLTDMLGTLERVIAAQLMAAPTLLQDTQHRRVALVGPTGVGKTTTIAKIAARMALLERKSVALITLDTYRIGAVEQLQQYANLIRIPLSVVHDAKSWSKAIAMHAKVDLLLVDTAGRGLQGSEHVAQLTGLFRDYDMSVHLAVAAATRHVELQSIIARFSGLQPQALIFTKLDEASGLGGVVNASARSGLPISYVTHGQRVPEDIAVADAKKLAQQLVERVVEAGRQGRLPAVGARLSRSDAQQAKRRMPHGTNAT